MTTIAFDPGGTTGVAIHQTASITINKGMTARDIVNSVTRDEYHMAAIKNPTDLWAIIDAHKPDVCIYENFASGGQISKDGQHTIRLCGAIEVICFRENIKCIMHIPGERHGMMPAARAMLRQLHRPLISHEVDALAHLLLYEHRVSMGIADQIYQSRRHPTEATV